MTEAEWLACDDATSLLLALRMIATDRKLRLLAASVLRLSLGEYPEDWHVTKTCVAHISSCEGLADGTGTPGQSDGHSTAWSAARADAYHALDGGKPSEAAILRDIFGNPFRPVAFSPEWRTDTAVTLARTMYDARDFSAAPILADALQDAGCDGDDVLNHLRGPGPHVRGCWVVDLVLGRE